MIRNTTFILFLFLWALQVNAQFMVDPTQGPGQSLLGNVEFSGLQNIDENLVLRRLGLEENTPYHPSVLRDKIQVGIKELYASNWFSDVEVLADYKDGGSLDLIVRLVEKPTAGDVYFEGHDEYLSEDLLEMVGILPGQSYGPEDVERYRQRIIEKYKEDGYLLVQISTDEVMNPNTGRKDITFNILEGQKLKVADILIFGNETLDSIGIVDAMGSEIDSWFGDGEFRVDQFKNDLDSILEHYRSFGFLDAAIVSDSVEYINDPSFHLYIGSTLPDSVKMPSLLNQINASLKKKDHPLTLAYKRFKNVRAGYFRRFKSRSENRFIATPPILNEVELVHFLNKTLDIKSLREAFIGDFALGHSSSNPLLVDLLAKEDISEAEQRFAVRHLFENRYPVIKYADANSSSKVKLHVSLSEGRQYYMGNFVFEGNEVYNDAQIASQYLVDSNQVFNMQLYRQSIQNIYNIYREEGYLFLQAKDKMDYRDSIVDVKINFVEGKPASINKIYVVGNTTTRDKVIRREIKIFPGDTYRQSLLERSFRDIMQLNYFDMVYPDVKIVGEQEVDLEFKVAEREAGTGQFNAGVQYNATEGFVGTLGVSIPNCCIGDGRKVDLTLEFGPNKQNYVLGITEPWFLDYKLGLGGSINYTNYSYDDGRPDVTRRGFSVFSWKRLTIPDDYFVFQTTYNWQENIQGDNSPGVVLYTGLESSVEFSLTRDDKNLPQFPTDGSRFQLSHQYAGLGGDFKFHKTDFSSKWWFPIIGDVALRLENNFGVITGDAIQYRTLYLMGGSIGYQGQMRGYPSGAIGNSQIGRSYYSFTSELSVPVVDQQFYLLGFFDAGNVFGGVFNTAETPENSELPSPIDEVDLTNLYKDYGFGFRIVIPMLGILGFDFGWPLVQQDGLGLTGMQTNFVITQGF